MALNHNIVEWFHFGATCLQQLPQAVAAETQFQTHAYAHLEMNLNPLYPQRRKYFSKSQNF